MVTHQVGIEPGARRRIGGRGRTATGQIATTIFAGEGSDTPPEEIQHAQIPVVPVNTRPPQFEDLVPPRFERSEIEFLGAVESGVVRSLAAGLQSVRARQLSGLSFLNEEMRAGRIEPVRVKPGCVSGREPFAEFKIEDLETQRLRRPHVRIRPGEAQGIDGAGDARAGLPGGFGWLAGGGQGGHRGWTRPVGPCDPK